MAASALDKLEATDIFPLIGSIIRLCKEALLSGDHAASLRKLLMCLRDWATQPQFSYSHKWSAGDAAMWDDIGALHRAMPYPADCGRTLHRTRLESEEPYA